MLTLTNRSICNVSSIDTKFLLINCVVTLNLLYYVLVSVSMSTSFGREKKNQIASVSKTCNFDIIGFKVLHDSKERCIKNV